MYTAVDVVIPTYNRPQLTCEAIDNVLKQKNIQTDIYIIDDHSLLKNSHTLRKHISNLECSNIFYYYLPYNKGPAYCRNYGVSLGKNDYIAFLDSDDLWCPEKLQKQVEFLKNHPSQYAHCNEIWEKNNQNIFPKKYHKKQGGFFIEKLFKRCLISPSAVIFKREFWRINNLHFHNSFRVAEDYELWLRLNLFYPIGYLEEPLVIKRAGSWKQLSSTIGIDRQRVLALHRLYRLYKNTQNFQKIFFTWKKETLYKINILLKGAKKYHKIDRIKEYTNWQKVIEKKTKQ